MIKRTFTTMYLAVLEELRGVAVHAIPQVRWDTYTATHHENGAIWHERRFVIYRQWLGRTYDYIEIVTDRWDTVSGSTEEEPWHAAQ